VAHAHVLAQAVAHHAHTHASTPPRASVSTCVPSIPTHTGTPSTRTCTLDVSLTLDAHAGCVTRSPVVLAHNTLALHIYTSYDVLARHTLTYSGLDLLQGDGRDIRY
jgi:hypothetical protein